MARKTNQKKAAFAGALAGFALIVGGASIAQGEPTASAAPAFAPVQQTTPEPDRDRDRDGRPCPEEGAQSGNEEQAAPTAPSPAPEL